MMFWIRFWSNLTKKDSVESAKYEIKKCLLVLTVLGRFLRIRILIFPDRIRIFGRSGFGLRKKVRSGSGKKDPDPKHCLSVLIYSSKKTEYVYRLFCPA